MASVHYKSAPLGGDRGVQGGHAIYRWKALSELVIMVLLVSFYAYKYFHYATINIAFTLQKCTPRYQSLHPTGCAIFKFFLCKIFINPLSILCIIYIHITLHLLILWTHLYTLTIQNVENWHSPPLRRSTLKDPFRHPSKACLVVP